MLRVPKLLITSLMCIALLSCQKEFSIDNGGSQGGSISGTAVFTLAGAPGGCVSPVIGGSYTQGIAMDASNTVALSVDVITLGTYVVSSDLINNVMFTGSGSFTTTGVQTIVLTGSGVPAAAGTYNFAHGATGCSFPITFTQVVTNPPAIGILDCATSTEAGVYTQGIALTGTNTISIPVNVTTPGTFSISTTAINGVTFSASGTLATGAQTIVLTGSGLPIDAGPFSFPVSLGTSNCSFSITFLPGVPPAEGTLDCASATFGGVYTQGEILTGSNTVTIPVNVTTAGPYSITTTATNGVTFSGSGTLATGAQTIVLTGTGTPINAGAISFPVSLGTSNCDFSITFLPGAPPLTDYFRVKIDGVLTTFHVNLEGDITPLLLPNTVVIRGDAVTAGDEHMDVTVQSINPIVAGTYFQDFNVSFATSRYYDPVSGQGFQCNTTSSTPLLTVIITSITSSRVTGTFSGQYFDLNGTGTNAKQFTEGEFSVPLP